jgi:hypothetical protein
MVFRRNQSAPKDRSIFRKNIGRALLHRDGDPYESIWDIDFTTRASREANGHRRDIEREQRIEDDVTRFLREQFTFRWIELDGQERRMVPDGLEAAFIGTIAKCGECRASLSWLGRSSPERKIRQLGLWLEQHLEAA